MTHSGVSLSACKRLKEILQGVDHQGLVGRKMRRARIHFSAIGPTDRGNLGVVGRNNDAVDLAHLPGDFNRPGEQRSYLPSDRMFFPGTDLLPPRAGMTAMTRFPFSIGCGAPASSFNIRPRAQSAEAVERLAIFGPFAGVNPGILADRENADAPAGSS